jgi:hypothetical protein
MLPRGNLVLDSVGQFIDAICEAIDRYAKVGYICEHREKSVIRVFFWHGGDSIISRACRASAAPVPSQLGYVGGSCSLPVSASQVSRLPTICFMARVKRSLSFISSRLLKR